MRYDAISAEVGLPGGDLVMTADGDSLSLRLSGPGEAGFEDAKALVAEHLDRAMGRESGLGCLWVQLS